ncbi:acyl-CoA dehydrogenase family protein [Streptomyces sp. NPDC090075]|uniref:acyl-CoA dehydrogenase family protein n=1 Tax=Streptomyces sp. NPDC090075 TaxID=3365937 RepID=UPI0037F7287C
MTTASSLPTTDPAQESLRQAAHRIGLQARAAAAANERDRRLTPDLVEVLRESGLMRCAAPAVLGAAQAPPGVALECAETIARGDAATGWCVAIAFTSSLLAAYLPAKGAEETLGAPRAIPAGVLASQAKARPVDGGMVVSGRWSFCSGITHADYFFAGCFLDDEGGTPRLRLVAVPVDQLRILDTWHTSGLRGTSSHDVVAEEVFVPAHRVVSLADGPLVDAPLYRFPFFGYLALAVAAVALGNARGAMDDLLALARDKVPTGSRRTLAENPATHAAVAQAEASLSAAQSFFYAAVGEAWHAASSSTTGSLELRAKLRLAATHAAQTASSVVRTMYDLGGGSVIYEDSPLQRRLRDASTITAHKQVNTATWEMTGSVLLGVPADVERL